MVNKLVAKLAPFVIARKYLRAYKAPLGTSTSVEDSLQISSFMQNKPNLVRRRRIANELKVL